MWCLKAEGWLREQAKALGWSKATKLEGRQTTQGLVGVVVNQGAAALVEVNCETDFVARNSTFQGLVGEAAVACLGLADRQVGTNGPLIKVRNSRKMLVKDIKNVKRVLGALKHIIFKNMQKNNCLSNFLLRPITYTAKISK